MSGKKTGRVAELEALVLKHQELYYNGHPEISDAEFDALWDELESLDPGNALLARIGKDEADGFPKAEHLIPMGSQAKAQDPEAFMKWAAKVGHARFLVQYKLDGASLELQYRDGNLMRAVTRGDGRRGDDITQNAVKMKGAVPRLDSSFSGGVRGEVIMSRAVKEKWFPDAANCRNAANGIMKRKDGAGAERLEIICYDATHSTAPSFFPSETAKLEWIKNQGFAVVSQAIFGSAEEVNDYRARVMAARPGLPYDIDGLVVKNDEIDPEDMKRARPEKQIAYKFSLDEAVSVLRSVEWSESGATYTPIGVIDPVQLMGTTVKRANLCNPDMLRKMDLRLGSRIVITKRGEIIPKIEALVENPPGSGEIPYPESCSCGAVLVDEGTRLYCPNPACPKRAFHRIMKWLSVLDVRDFGETIAKRLFDSGRIKGIPDLYGLSEAELAEYDRMGAVLARKILRNLSEKKEIPFPAFIAGFDIEGIGELITERFVQAGYGSLGDLREASSQELSLVFGVGELTARALKTGLEELGPEMDALLSTGKVRIAEAFGGGPLAGKSFCFTGELVSMKRPVAEARVRALGGTAKSSVTKDLSYLVTNDPGSGSSKNEKAKSLGVRILGERDFLSLIGEGS
jgi:DNA ligase (NAD+)